MYLRTSPCYQDLLTELPKRGVEGEGVAEDERVVGGQLVVPAPVTAPLIITPRSHTHSSGVFTAKFFVNSTVNWAESLMTDGQTRC